MAASIHPKSSAALREPAKRFSLADFEVLGTVFASAAVSVYKARHTASRELVALKHRAVPELRDAPRGHEASLMASLRHPHIIACWGTALGPHGEYTVLEWAPGGSLSSLLAQQPQKKVSGAVALSWLRQICAATVYLHERGIVHRDIKPANILVASAAKPGCVDACPTDLAQVHLKLADFGIGRDVGGRALGKATASLHTFHGTPLYVSPEMADGEPYSKPSDAWAIGILLYELVAGCTPFARPSLKGTLHAISVEPARALAEPQPELVSRLLQGLLLKCPKRRLTPREALTLLEEDGVHSLPGAVHAPERAASPASTASHDSAPGSAEPAAKSTVQRIRVSRRRTACRTAPPPVSPSSLPRLPGQSEAAAEQAIFSSSKAAAADSQPAYPSPPWNQRQAVAVFRAAARLVKAVELAGSHLYATSGASWPGGQHSATDAVLTVATTWVRHTLQGNVLPADLAVCLGPDCLPGQVDVNGSSLRRLQEVASKVNWSLQASDDDLLRIRAARGACDKVLLQVLKCAALLGAVCTDSSQAKPAFRRPAPGSRGLRRQRHLLFGDAST